MREDTNKAFLNILDCMTGADGALRFVRLKGFLENLDRMALEGDMSAQEIILIVLRFSRIIDIANKDIAQKETE